MRKIFFFLLVAAFVLIVVGLLWARAAHAAVWYTWEFRLEGVNRWSYGGSFSSDQGCQTFDALWTSGTGRLIAQVRIRNASGNIVATLTLYGGTKTWCPPSAPTPTPRPWWQRWFC